MKNFENLKAKKKNQNSAFCSTQWPPDNWPGLLDHLVIVLVDIKYTKLGKIGEKLLLVLGLAHMNFPLCYSHFCESSGQKTGWSYLCAMIQAIQDGK